MMSQANEYVDWRNTSLSVTCRLWCCFKPFSKFVYPHQSKMDLPLSVDHPHKSIKLFYDTQLVELSLEILRVRKL